MVQLTASGLVPPVFTPFSDDFTVNYAAIPPYMQFLVKANIKGILVGGTTGEGPSLTFSERKKLTEAWVAAAKPHGVHVMVQVGGGAMPDVLELAKHAEASKADSLLTLPELYFKPGSVDELVDYIEQISKAAPSLPVLYYHIPAWSGVALNMPKFIAAATARVPNFKGIKFTSNDLSEGAQALRTTKPGQDVFLGADTLLASAALLGYKSSIGTTYNFLPGLAADILKAVEASDVKKAKSLQEKLTAYVEIIAPEGSWVSTMKVGMELLTNINVGPPRYPLKPLTAEQVKRIETKLRDQGLL